MRAEVVVRPSVLAREDLSVQECRERLLREDSPSKPEAAEERCLILAFGIREVRAGRWPEARAGRTIAGARFRRCAAGGGHGERQPVLRRLRQPLVLEEHGREDELQVGRREAVARADEGHGLSEVRGERATAAKHPADEIAQRIGRGQGLHTLRPHEQAVGEVIDQVRADGGELANDVDTSVLERVARAEARELQEVRAADRTGAEDHPRWARASSSSSSPSSA